jgi:cytochrome c oxidase assembly factor CtaG
VPSASSWQLAWEELAVVALLAVGYVVASRRHPASRWREAAFGASLGLILAVSVTPLATLALHYLLSAHLFQNVVLAEWAPALAVAGIGAGMAGALAGYAPVRWLTHPLVALPLWVASYDVWHIPALYEAALRNQPLLHLEHASYFLTGALLWWPLLHDAPRRLSSGGKAAYAFGAFLLASPVGLMLALLPRPIYDFYAEAPRVRGISSLTDQQMAGVLMAVSEAVVFFAAFAYFFLRFLAEEE